METVALATTSASLPRPLNHTQHVWEPSWTLDLIKERLTEGKIGSEVRRSWQKQLSIAWLFGVSQIWVGENCTALPIWGPCEGEWWHRGGDKDREYDHYMFLFNLSFWEGCRESPERKCLGHLGFQLLRVATFPLTRKKRESTGFQGNEKSVIQRSWQFGMKRKVVIVQETLECWDPPMLVDGWGKLLAL